MDHPAQLPDHLDKRHLSDGAEVSVPLAVDLDGTLIRTNSLIESLIALTRANPFFLAVIFVWLVRGRAYLKQQVARRVLLDISGLPYNLEILGFLRDEYNSQRRLILATGADERIAGQIAEYLHIFDKVIASDGQNNLTGVAKKEALVAEFGLGGFDYLGGDRHDVFAWQAARRAMVVGSKSFIDRMVARLSKVDKVFVVKTAGWREWIRALRLYHWLKNLLVFVPLLAAHRFNEINLIFSGCQAFLSFSFCASSVYVLNDLLDLPEDRRHPRKRSRAFASGILPLATGLTVAPMLLGISIAIGLTLPPIFLIVLGLYYTITLAYSFRLKRIVILDVIVLATLFTVRMMAGSAATDVWPSSWLLAHSMFLFISLALVKRYAELVTMRLEQGQAAKARSYVASDSELLASMGAASAFSSVLVLVLYINSESAQLLYGHLTAMWLVCPALLYWLCYIWLTAHRGEMHDDPMIFALKDRVSRYILISMVIAMLLAI